MKKAEQKARERRLSKLKKRGPLVETWTASGLRISAPPDRYIGIGLAGSGTWEPHVTAGVMAALRRRLQDHEVPLTFIDAGAHVGWFALNVAHEFVGLVEVLAFEPDPELLSILKRNVLANGLSVRCIGTALGHTQAWCDLYCSPSNTGDNRLMFFGGIDGFRRVQVPMTRLDNVVQRVDVMKMDVQGCEARALLGATGTEIGTCFLEFDAKLLEAAGSELIDLKRLIEGRWERLDRVNRDGTRQPFEWERCQEKSWSECDVVAYNGEKP